MKEFKNINEQIEILKSRNLNIINEITAKENLLMYGYYEIVNGYKNILLNEIGVPQYLFDSDLENIFNI